MRAAAAAPHSLSIEDVGRLFETDTRWGLTEQAAGTRSERDGPNELPAPHKGGLVTRIRRTVAEPMAVLLLIAAAVSGFALNEAVEAVAIAFVVVVNSFISILQETKAENALVALRRMETSEARVVRQGRSMSLSPAELVVGDLVVLGEGDRVPADLRLTVTDALSMDESALTGESLPSDKHAASLVAEDAAVAERLNSAFSGTLVTHGSGAGVVVATGLRTQIGDIAASLSGRKTMTPLQLELGKLTRSLAFVALMAGSAAFGFAAFRSSAPDIDELFVGAVALAVAAVPEGLATVVAVALAVGVSKMATEGAIVRHLPAVETLGATTVIATDKTGTLTMNQLVVRDRWSQEGHGDRLEMVAALCNDAELGPDTGDPLDVALLRWVGAERADDLRQIWSVTSKEPFDSVRRYMEVTCASPEGEIRLLKGAPEAVLAFSARDPMADERIDQASASMAERGLKVIAFAAGEIDRRPSLVGLVGLGDPLRPEAAATVCRARRAGVRVVMVTGDHPATARAIATEVGIDAEKVLLGNDLDDESIALSGVDVLARTTPIQKLKLVERLQREGEVVAVTGDGVNDAPALQRSDVGVAMGRAGTEVAKNAADVVVTDDNLSTIVTAIREGRGIYANLRRVVHYLVSANLCEIIVVLSCFLLFPGLGIPLLPLQLLWVNLLTDALPAIGLGMDRPSENALMSPPRSRTERLMGLRSFSPMAFSGTVLAGGALAALAVSRFAWDQSWTRSRTTLFLTLVLSQLAYAVVVRASTERRARPGNSFWSNGWLVAGVGGGVVLQLAMMASPWARDLLEVVSLHERNWALVGVAGLLPPAILAGIGWLRDGAGPGTERPVGHSRSGPAGSYRDGLAYSSSS